VTFVKQFLVCGLISTDHLSCDALKCRLLQLNSYLL